MLEGIKTATTRNRLYGIVGDTFEAFGMTFEIQSHERIELGQVAEKYYKEEGFSFPDQFINCWKEIHPRAGWTPRKMVFLHRFALLGKRVE